MKFCFALIAALMLPIGCGDNSDECGPGTHAVDGVCTPDGTTTCSDGTKLDSSTGTCVIDPNDCQDGTLKGASDGPGWLPLVTLDARAESFGRVRESPPASAGWGLFR